MQGNLAVAARTSGRLVVVAAIVAASLTAPLTALGTAAPTDTPAPRQGIAVVDPAVVDGIVGGSVEAIVQVQRGVRDLAVRAVTGNGGVVRATFDLIEGFAATLTPAALDALRTVTGVTAISLDGPVSLSHTPPLGESNGDHRFDETVRATSLHDEGLTGSGVGIAVLDTGVTSVPDLAGRVVGGVDLSGGDSTADEFGHGTFIASIAAGDGAASNGRFAGVAPGAHVVPIKIAGRNGASNVSHVLAGIEWAVSFKDTYDIGVLNLSLGTDSTQTRLLSPMNYAVERAWDSGIVVVVSGGNHGEDGAGRIPKPADDPFVITVGATDANGTVPTSDDTVAAYSSRGPSIADGIQKPDIVAPGSHLIGAKAPGSAVDVEHPEAHIRGDYLRGSGTSFAAAVTSGAVALLREAHPEWTPDQVKGAILATAAPGPVGDRNVDGAGILDVAAAAALTTAPAANQGIVRSTGLGSLAADRGTLGTAIELGGGLGLLELTGELTAQNTLWDPIRYTTSEWNGNNWYGNNWYGNNWYGNNWYSAGWQ